jgi:NAD(P)-dependent dehydrogenase (short-subunit alcohol dehydrogenase family)
VPDFNEPKIVARFRAGLATAIEVLEAVVENRTLLADIDPALRRRLLTAAGRASKPEKADRRKLARAHQRLDKLTKRETEETLLARTGIRQLRENPLFLTPRRRRLHAERGAEVLPEAEQPPEPPIGEVEAPRTCYVCRTHYTGIHFFYDQMCVACGDFNYAKRSQSADLRGRVALVTGARVKIGYQAAIMLLRAGCHVIVLTRFPKDAARRYSREEDFGDWGDHLEIHGIDLRHIPSVERLCGRLCEAHERLDFIINNACQTVRRPPGFYDHLMATELAGPDPLEAQTRALLAPEDTRVAVSERGRELPAAALSQVPLIPGDTERGETLFPTGSFDADSQQVDLREMNSWRLKMAEVPTVELLEVHLVNAVAPFILNARLKPLMMAVPTRDKHIVNVSAMEGQFYRTFKSARHPHTNMAKASLNMMTRTSALDYIDDGIHMNSVDTGWVTDEDPAALAERKREMHRFHPPLDIVDGAARIVDPIFSGILTGEHVWGQFLKDYRITDW